MKKISISRNDAIICSLSLETEVFSFDVMVDACVEGVEVASLWVKGFIDGVDGFPVSVTWFNGLPLILGDVLDFEFATNLKTSTLNNKFSVDDKLTGKVDDFLGSEVEIRPLAQDFPNTKIQFSSPVLTQPVIASFEGGREFIDFSYRWLRYQPQICRVALKAFSTADALCRNGGNDIFREKLSLGESCAIRIL